MNKFNVMGMMKYFLLMPLFCSAAFAEQGAIVKCTQPDGSVVYTNQGCESGKSEKVKLREQDSVSSATTAEFAFLARESNVEVAGEGAVTKILADDKSGGRHQRFIIKLTGGQTLLIAYNIDLAPRIDSLQIGDSIKFYGEYLWNEKGGIVHWMHRDPQGKHEAGWIEYKGRRYE